MGKNNKNMKTILMSWGGALLISASVGSFMTKDLNPAGGAGDLEASIAAVAASTPKLAIVDNGKLLNKYKHLFIKENKNKPGITNKDLQDYMVFMMAGLLEREDKMNKAEGYFFLAPGSYLSFAGPGISDFSKELDQFLMQKHQTHAKSMK